MMSMQAWSASRSAVPRCTGKPPSIVTNRPSGFDFQMRVLAHVAHRPAGHERRQGEVDVASGGPAPGRTRRSAGIFSRPDDLRPGRAALATSQMQPAHDGVGDAGHPARRSGPDLDVVAGTGLSHRRASSVAMTSTISSTLRSVVSTTTASAASVSGRGLAALVEGVAAGEVGGDGLVVEVGDLLAAALGPDLGIGGQVHLELRVGEHDGADVATLEHAAAPLGRPTPAGGGPSRCAPPGWRPRC